MVKANSMISLFTPEMAGKLINRTGNIALERWTKRKSMRFEHDWLKRIEAGQTIIDWAESAANPDTLFIAAECLKNDRYGRKSAEKSGCPVLMSKYGFVGRFIMASYTYSENGAASLTGVLYEDKTESHQDSLVRTRFSVQTGELVSQTRFPDVLRYRDKTLPTDGMRHSSPLSAVNQLSELVSNAIVSIDPRIIASSMNHYNQRVGQYHKLVTAEIIPFIPSQRENPNQFATTSETLT